LLLHKGQLLADDRPEQILSKYYRLITA
jgi:hypothetical protein